jgi:hypothetical protein
LVVGSMPPVSPHLALHSGALLLLFAFSWEFVHVSSSNLWASSLGAALKWARSWRESVATVLACVGTYSFTDPNASQPFSISCLWTPTLVAHGETASCQPCDVH